MLFWRDSCPIRWLLDEKRIEISKKINYDYPLKSFITLTADGAGGTWMSICPSIRMLHDIFSDNFHIVFQCETS